MRSRGVSVSLVHARERVMRRVAIAGVGREAEMLEMRARDHDRRGVSQIRLRRDLGRRGDRLVVLMRVVQLVGADERVARRRGHLGHRRGNRAYQEEGPHGPSHSTARPAPVATGGAIRPPGPPAIRQHE